MLTENDPTNTAYAKKSPPIDLQKIMDEVALQTTGQTITFPSRFTFTWHNIGFIGQILPSKEPERFSINLVANLGYIPFSAEDNARRRKLLKTFTPLFITGDYSLSVNSQIQMILLTDFTGPANAKRLMEAITYTLLDLLEDLRSIRDSVTN